MSPAPELPCAPEEADAFLGAPAPELAGALAGVPGRVLVLGAGGKMGLHLCLLLQGALRTLGREADLLAVSRFTTLRDGADFARHGLATHAADLSDPTAVAALPDAGAVFFLAGVKFGTAAAPELLHRMNVEVPGLVAARFAGARIVAFSTGCVYPFVSPDSGGATEATPPAPPGDYARSCLGREEAFAEGARRHGTPVTLLRLNYAVEFRYGVLADIAGRVLREEPVDVTTGYVNVIWQRDALVHTVRALEVAGAPAVPLNVTGPDVLRVRDLAREVGRLLGKEPRLAGAEAPTAWLNDARAAHRRFGLPPTDLPTMQRWVAAWLLRGGGTWGKPTGFERRDGRF